MYASLILLTSHLQASASSQLDMVMPGAVSTSGQNHPLVERQKLTCGVSVCRLPAVCRDFILSWCHTWSLLSLHTKESQVFRGPWSVPQRDLIGAIHRFVMRDANRHVLRKSQHLHPSDAFLLPAMWRRFPSTTAAARGHTLQIARRTTPWRCAGNMTGDRRLVRGCARIAKKGTSKSYACQD